MKKLIVLFTNDVETTSIINHSLRDITGEYVLKQGIPRLLELYEKYDVRATFFFTGHIARLFPDVVRMVQPYGHEIGSHGLTHEVSQAFDILPISTQIEHLIKSKEILENISGSEVISFRAPSARVNKGFPIALMKAGYKIDSSVASQRIDMFLSFGSLNKMNWLRSPRKPYFTDPDDIFRKGNSEIFEIPISAMLFPYIGTFMRIAPNLNRATRHLLYLETLATGRPFNFLTHPNEFIDEKREVKTIERRGGNVFSYLLGDLMRHRLKVRNLGAKALPLLEHELKFFSRKKFRFVTCREYYELNLKDYAS